jgi:hypothetical protein
VTQIALFGAARRRFWNFPAKQLKMALFWMPLASRNFRNSNESNSNEFFHRSEHIQRRCQLKKKAFASAKRVESKLDWKKTVFESQHQREELTHFFFPILHAQIVEWFRVFLFDLRAYDVKRRCVTWVLFPEL